MTIDCFDQKSKTGLQYKRMCYIKNTTETKSLQLNHNKKVLVDGD